MNFKKQTYQKKKKYYFSKKNPFYFSFLPRHLRNVFTVYTNQCIKIIIIHVMNHIIYWKNTYFIILIDTITPFLLSSTKYE